MGYLYLFTSKREVRGKGERGREGGREEGKEGGEMPHLCSRG